MSKTDEVSACIIVFRFDTTASAQHGNILRDTFDACMEVSIRNRGGPLFQQRVSEVASTSIQQSGLSVDERNHADHPKAGTDCRSRPLLQDCKNDANCRKHKANEQQPAIDRSIKGLHSQSSWWVLERRTRTRASDAVDRSVAVALIERVANRSKTNRDQPMPRDLPMVRSLVCYYQQFTNDRKIFINGPLHHF